VRQVLEALRVVVLDDQLPEIGAVAGDRLKQHVHLGRVLIPSVLDELDDRERLALALEELRQAGLVYDERRELALGGSHVALLLGRDSPPIQRVSTILAPGARPRRARNAATCGLTNAEDRLARAVSGVLRHG
jgi:hypothetical protein